MLTRVTRSNQPVLRFSAGASSGSVSLDSEDVSSSEGWYGIKKSFSSSPSEVEVSTLLEVSLSDGDIVSL